MRRKETMRAVLLGISAAMIVAGLMRGELVDVMTRASIICMECIGIG